MVQIWGTFMFRCGILSLKNCSVLSKAFIRPQQSSRDRDQPRGHRFLACVSVGKHPLSDRCVPTSACTMEGRGRGGRHKNNLETVSVAKRVWIYRGWVLTAGTQRHNPLIKHWGVGELQMWCFKATDVWEIIILNKTLHDIYQLNVSREILQWGQCKMYIDITLA